ncbi:MAG: hypothetical protein ACM3SY_21400 [Candidatus Omnitrophota bacterium]
MDKASLMQSMPPQMLGGASRQVAWERGPGERVFINDVFEKFYQKRAILLLVQEDRWQAAIEHLLAEGKALFLLLSGFENSCEQGRIELAGVLRGLNETYPQSFKVLGRRILADK